MDHQDQQAAEERGNQQLWQATQVQHALAQARTGQGIPLQEYVERSIANGSSTREGYKRALVDEMRDDAAHLRR